MTKICLKCDTQTRLSETHRERSDEYTLYCEQCNDVLSYITCFAKDTQTVMVVWHKTIMGIWLLDSLQSEVKCKFKKITNQCYLGYAPKLDATKKAIISEFLERMT